MARKSTKWVVAPRPGPHKKLDSVPLQVLLRDVLGILEKGKEVRTVIKQRQISVDGKVRRDHAYPVGLFDVVSIPATGKHYRAVPTKKTLEFIEIPAEEAKVKVCKILGKTTLKKGKTQLRLHDGRTIITDKDSFKTGDSILIGIPLTKIADHFKMEKGAFGVVTKGKDAGSFGNVKDVIVTKTKDPTKLIYETKDGERETLKDRFFVIGKGKPAIKVSD